MIQINDLNYHYQKARPMFKGINLSLDKGAIYGLLGKNGAGKSTLLKNIMGSLHPTAGTCLLDNEKTMLRKVATLEKIYFIPEQINAPAVTVNNLLKMNSPFYPKFSQQTFDEIMKEFDLETNLKLNQLSHGQQKKVALAFGIATNTDWLLLDEPTNGLDIPSKTAFKRVLSSYISEERGIIISTHQIADIEKLIEQLVVIDEGKLLLNKSLMEIAEKLTFSLVNGAIENQEHILYAEKFGIGAKVIGKNTSHSEGQIDLELLFNGLVSKNDTLLNYLN